MYYPRSVHFTLEQLESIERFSFTDSPEADLYSRPTLGSITVESMMEIVPNLPSPTKMGFRRPQDAVTVYESIQKYLSLWMDILNDAPEFPIPPVAELYELEGVAEWAFSHHYNQKLAQKDRQLSEEDALLQSLPLLRLGLAFQDNPNDKESFVSHLDMRLPPELKALRPGVLANDVDWGNETAWGNDFLNNDIFGKKGLL